MENSVACEWCKWIGGWGEQQLPEEWGSSGRKDTAAEPQMFCARVTLFFPLFHYKELALWEDVDPKRLHPSRRPGFHSGVIDTVNQRGLTEDKPIGGVDKLTIAAQWVSFPSSFFFMSVRFIHLTRTLLLCIAKQACPTFIASFPPFTWKKCMCQT